MRALAGNTIFAIALAAAHAAPAALAGQDVDLPLFHYSLIDADAGRSDDATLGRWEGSGWIGTDFDRVWWSTSGEVAGGGVGEAEAMLLYGHYARRFWDLVVGYRHDIEPRSQGYFTFGLMGLAPYWFDVELLGFISQRGEPSIRFEAENDLYLTQRLVLQLATELDWLLSADDELDLEPGLHKLEVLKQYFLLPGHFWYFCLPVIGA